MSSNQDILYILIIEDNPGDFVLLEDYLIEKFRTITIEHCKNYDDAVTVLNSKKEFSVILLDLTLPGISGLNLVKNIISLSDHIPVIILTGYSDINIAKLSLKMGAYDFLIKDEANAEIVQKSILYTLNRSSYVNQLEEAKLNYENLFNFSPQPMWLVDSNTLKFLNANFAAVKKYGYTLEEFLDKSLFDIHPPNEIQAIEQRFKTKEFSVSKNSFTHILNNGEEIKVEMHLSQMDDISGEDFIILANDITDNLKFIDIIQNQNEKLRKIAWTQSHVVRAPLSRILGIINLIESQADKPDDLPFLLKQLRVSSDEMDEIVKKIVHETKQVDGL